MILASYYERNQPAVSMRLNPNDSGSTISSPVPAQASSEPQQLHQQYPPSVSTPTGVLRKQGMYYIVHLFICRSCDKSQSVKG